MNVWKCLRCGWEWASRLDGRPVYCAGCRCRNWWRPARETNPIKIPKPRPLKYPQIRALEIGESVIIPWDITPGGLPDSRVAANLGRAIRHIEKYDGKTFRRFGHGAGLAVVRLT